MDKRQRTRLQLLLVSFAISAVASVLAGWVANDIFRLPFAPVFVVVLLLICIPSGRAMLKIPINDAGKIEANNDADINSNGLASTASRQSDAKKLARFRRILLRGLLVGMMGLVTVVIVAAVHITSRLGVTGLHRMLDTSALPSDAAIVGGSLVLGILVAVVLEATNSWKG
jgi:hypothetical protein